MSYVPHSPDDLGDAIRRALDAAPKAKPASRPKISTIQGFPARVCKRPKVGEIVTTKFGCHPITKVYNNGLRLDIATTVHGAQNVERAPHGHWTIRLGENIVT